MLKILLVNFPFLDDPQKTKVRPALCLTKPVGKHKIIIVAFITTQIDEVLETDVLLDSSRKDFSKTGLKYTSLIKLHKITSVPLDAAQGEIGILSSEQERDVKNNLKKLLLKNIK